MYSFAYNEKELNKLSKLANYIQENPEKSLDDIEGFFDCYTKEQIEQFYYIFNENGKIGVSDFLHQQITHKQMLIYFMFNKNLNEEPNKNNVIENWRREWITIDDDNDILNLEYDEHLYVFEIYILREQCVPPAFYFDTNFEYKFVSRATIDVIRKNYIDIKPLQKLVGDELYLKIVSRLQEYEVEANVYGYYVHQYKNEAVKNFNKLLQRAAQNNTIEKLLSIVKINDWCKEEIYMFGCDTGVTIFQYIFLQKYYYGDDRSIQADIFENSYYDGCLQEKISFMEEDIYNYKWGDDEGPLSLTPAQLYIYCQRKLPPQKFCYNGWEHELVTYYNYSYTLPQFWLICTKKNVPTALQISGWNNENNIFSFAVLKHGQTIKRGNMCDAYNYYKLLFGVDEVDKQFIVTNDGECVVCMEQHKKLYNFCKNQHSIGFCKDCYENMSMTNRRCPICNCRIK